jgi:hypothetical protein
MSKLFFKPWVGKDYENSKYGKILILGESHYGGEKCQYPEFTHEVIKEYLSGEYYPAYRIYSNLGLIFNESDKYELWHNVAYANLIQYALSDSDAQPNSSHIETIIPAFWEILDLVKPQRIIFCSKRLWNNWLPDNDTRCRMVGTINENSKESAVWEYNYNGGKAMAIGINHPTSFGFSNNQWRPLILKFIEY